MNTQPVRAFDDKGRHTTTRRQMIKLTEGRGLLIDCLVCAKCKFITTLRPFHAFSLKSKKHRCIAVS